jgi:membrane-bound metal-dependent hydrolase YbcI (DUF457 family)
VLFEHLIYSTAIAMIAGMLWYKYKGEDPSWIIIASAFAPDLDILAGYIFKQFDIAVLINGIPLRHGNFHNIAVLLIFAGVVGLLCKPNGLKFKVSFMFAAIGFGAHILEDVLVYNPGYAFLWPLSSHVFGIGIVDYKPDFYGIANTEVLIAGVIALLLCVAIRLFYEGDCGSKRFIKGFAASGIFSILVMSAIGFYNDNLKEEGITGNIVDNWLFSQNASWDSTFSHNGSHSAKIEISGNRSAISGIWRSNKIPLKADTNYTFSSWGKSEGTGGNYSPAFRIVEYDAKAKLIRQTNLVFSNGTYNWTQKKIILKTRSNSSWFYVYGNIWQGYGTVWFDDVELYEVGTDKNIISNGGFESGIKNIINIKI